MATKKIKTTCCVVGGGPAGLMLGFLLARSGVEVVVLEKHSDFLRDFRGDTVHPSTLELMHELGILDKFLELPHEKLTDIGAVIGDEHIDLVDFSYLRTAAKYIVLMPQWDFLDFIAGQAKEYKQFNLMMKTNATRLKEENGKVVGVLADTADGEVEIDADLVVGADGRASILRDSAGLEVKNVGAPMDVLWMRLSRKDNDPEQSLGRINYGAFMVMLNRGSYWQCGYMIPKGRFEEYKAKGLQDFREAVEKVAPFTSDRLDELKTWDDVKLLTVKVDRLKKWYKEGLLCIGDAAHAMSPVAGVGINLAVQDAVATANILWKPLREKRVSNDYLEKVQKRRLYPARMMQRFQVFAQNNVILPAIKSSGKLSPPKIMQIFEKIPRVRAVPGALIGLGFRAEHITSPDLANQEITI